MSARGSIEKVIEDIESFLFRLSTRVKHLEEIMPQNLDRIQRTLNDSIKTNEMSILKLDKRITSDLEFLEDKFKGRLAIVRSEIDRILDEEVIPLSEKISSYNIAEKNFDV